MSVQCGLRDFDNPRNFSNRHGAFVVKVLSALQPGSRQGFRSPTISTSRTTPQSFFSSLRNQAPLKLGDQAKQVHEEPRHRAFARINPLLCDDKCDAIPVKVCQHIQRFSPPRVCRQKSPVPVTALRLLPSSKSVPLSTISVSMANPPPISKIALRPIRTPAIRPVTICQALIFRAPYIQNEHYSRKAEQFHSLTGFRHPGVRPRHAARR